MMASHDQETWPQSSRSCSMQLICLGRSLTSRSKIVVLMPTQTYASAKGTVLVFHVGRFGLKSPQTLAAIPGTLGTRPGAAASPCGWPPALAPAPVPGVLPQNEERTPRAYALHGLGRGFSCRCLELQIVHPFPLPHAVLPLCGAFAASAWHRIRQWPGSWGREPRLSASCGARGA